MGVEIRVEHLTKRFGRQTIWEDVTLTLPAGEISVLLGPSGTGKSVFLKTVIGLLKPENGSIVIDGTDITKVKEKQLYEVRKLFGVLFQDGALFGSQNLYDNIAFPLREHTKKSEKEIRTIVMDKLEIVGMTGTEKKLPGEISGGMRKRAGIARALVLDPQILLFDEPDSGLDPVRTAYLNQLIVDLNAQIEATFLIVTHDINTARTVPDNIGLLYRRHLAMFGPREMLLSSNEPVVRQFLNAQRQGPIGMSEEKDSSELEAEKGIEIEALPPIPVQLPTSSGKTRKTERPPGTWLRANNITPPPGSFPGLDLGLAESPTEADAPAETPGESVSVRIVPAVGTEERVNRARAAAERSAASAAASRPPAKKTPAKAASTPGKTSLAKTPAAQSSAVQSAASKSAAAKAPLTSPTAKAPGATSAAKTRAAQAAVTAGPKHLAKPSSRAAAKKTVPKRRGD